MAKRYESKSHLELARDEMEKRLLIVIDQIRKLEEHKEQLEVAVNQLMSMEDMLAEMDND